MKKFIATLISLIVLSMMALPAAAQTRQRCSKRSDNQSRYSRNNRYDGRYDNTVYRDDNVYNNDNMYRNDGYATDDYRYGDNRSVWQKHRDKITTAGSAAGGALLGGLIGGKKGAVIGAVTGGAGAAIYTYKIRNRDGRY